MKYLVAGFVILLSACQQDKRHHPPVAPSAPRGEQVEKIENREDLREKVKEAAIPDEAITPNEEARRKLADKVWKTTLGQMYKSYLYTDKRDELPAQAQAIVTRILSETDQAPARVAAMHVMNEDINIRKEFSEDRAGRIALLDLEMSHSRHKEKSKVITLIFGQIPIMFLATLTWGSPLIRSEYQKTVNQFTKRGVARIRRKEVPPYEKIQWKRIMSADSLENYEFGKAVSSFSKTFAPVSMLEWMWVQRSEEKAGEEIPRKDLEGLVDL